MRFTLKQARLIREKHQEEMAELLDMHVQTYQKLEKNPDNVTIGQAKKIAEYLDIPYNDIFFD